MVHNLNILTGEVAPETCLGSDHPFCSSFTEDCNGAFWLLPGSCQPTAKLADYCIKFIVGHPFILPQDQLEGKKAGWLTFLAAQSRLLKNKRHNSENPYFFKYFTGGLNLIVFTQNISNAKTMWFSKALHSIVKKFVQRVLAWEVLPCQGIEVIHGSVWSFSLAWSGLGLFPHRQSFPLASTSDIVPRQEGEDGV